MNHLIKLLHQDSKISNPLKKTTSIDVTASRHLHKYHFFLHRRNWISALLRHVSPGHPVHPRPHTASHTAHAHIPFCKIYTRFFYIQFSQRPAPGSHILLYRRPPAIVYRRCIDPAPPPPPGPPSGPRVHLSATDARYLQEGRTLGVNKYSFGML